MNYEEIRSRIRSGDLLAWSHRGWRSWYDVQIQLVRMFTRSEFCHVALAWVAGGRVFALEAVGAGVRLMPLSLVRPFYRLPMDELRWEAEEFAMSQVSRPYSKWQAVQAALGVLKIGADSTWQCAEYVIEVLRRNGNDLACSATPSAVVQEALKRGTSLRYVQ